jgi:hypothetical protein
MSHAADEKYFLVVKFWVAPETEARMMRWLDGGHMAEVAGQPGFRWCKRIRLARDADGWQGYSMIYGIESKAAFDAYESNHALKAKFAKEREPFAGHLKMDRFSGEVVAHA